MADYLIDTKSIFSSLVIIGFPISNTNFVEYVVNGLGLEYQYFIISLYFLPSTIFDVLYDFLLHEEYLKNKHSGMSTPIVAMATTRASLQSSGLSKHFGKRNFHGKNKSGHSRGHGNGGPSTPY